MMSYEERLGKAVRLVLASQRIVAFTGAGISTESGLSDFRSPGGIWERHRIVMFQEFVASHEARVEAWTMRRELNRQMMSALPNKAHVALAALERKGKLSCLITQNIDGLHQEAGSSNVIELHGTNRKVLCLSCGKTWPMGDIQRLLDAGNLDPSCDDCKGIIKPATVSFGQAMPEREMELAFTYSSKCDLFIMIGSSLQVEPAASYPRLAHRAGARLIFVNRTETPWDHIATVLFREDAGQVIGDIAGTV